MPGVVVRIEIVEPSTGDPHPVQERTVLGENAAPAGGTAPPTPEHAAHSSHAERCGRATDAIDINVDGEECVLEPPD